MFNDDNVTDTSHIPTHSKNIMETGMLTGAWVCA